MTNMTSEQLQNILTFLKSDYEYYTKDFLKIATKEGGVPVPFIMNKSQAYLHYKLEDLKKQTGCVRAIVLKGRQQGISTYITARFFHQVSLNPGKQAMVLAHTTDSTSYLFQMIKRYFDKLPEDFQPVLRKSNAKEIVFEELESCIRTATAGGIEIGRGSTNHMLHMSEFAFYPGKPETIFASVLQSVPSKNSEIIVESTANGVNHFKKIWDDAVSGASNFTAIFIPWYWEDGYTIEIPETFALEDEEIQLLETYGNDGLTKEHLAWRRFKIKELGELQFRQEYPLNANEAFITSNDSFISSESVQRAATNLHVYESETAPLMPFSKIEVLLA